MTPSLMLRPFDEEDWFLFSGCDSPEPLVAHTKDYSLVLDGTRVEVYRQPFQGNEPYCLSWEFVDVGTAMLFVLSLRGLEPDEILRLKAQATGGRLTETVY